MNRQPLTANRSHAFISKENVTPHLIRLLDYCLKWSVDESFQAENTEYAERKMSMYIPKCIRAIKALLWKNCNSYYMLLYTSTCV